MTAYKMPSDSASITPLQVVHIKARDLADRVLISEQTP